MKSPRVLVLPGWQNSGPLHWQSLWEAQYGYERVEQHDWMRPLRGDWIARLEDVLRWGAQFVDYGQSGHINAGAGLGLWPDGRRFLMGLCQEIT